MQKFNPLRRSYHRLRQWHPSQMRQFRPVQPQQVIKPFSSVTRHAFHTVGNRFAHQPKFIRPSASLFRHQRRTWRRAGTQAAGFDVNNKWLRLGGAVLVAAATYYGLQVLNQPLGVSSEVGGVRMSSIDAGVSQYIRGTYAYLMSGVSITAASAIAAFRSGAVMRVASMNPMMYLAVFGLSSIALMYACRAIPVENTVMKHAAFVAFTALQGLSISTLGFLGGAVMIKAALYTFAVFAGMSAVAMNAQEERFLYLGGPLMAGVCVLMAASLSSMFLPARFVKTTNILHNLILYGGLGLFTVYLLYDTQKMMVHGKQFARMKAREESALKRRNFQANIQPDYISEALHIYLDVLNIFIRLAIIFGNQKKK